MAGVRTLSRFGRLASLATLATLGLLAMRASADEIAPDGQRVVQVRIEGNSTVKLAQLPKLTTRGGQLFERKTVDDDTRELLKSHKFLNVEPLFQQTPAGVIVIFKVLERPVFQYIKYLGSKDFEDSTLKKQTDLDVGQPLDPYAVKEGARKIEDFYHEHGHNHARVDIVEGDKLGDKGAVYIIHEGETQRIYSTRFVGNTIASDARLHVIVDSKPGILWIFKGFFDKKKLNEDIDKLTEYYRALGFFEARIGRELEFNDKENWLTITFVINEGPRYRIRNVSVLGNKIFTAGELTKDFRLKQGDFFDKSALDKDLGSIRDVCGGQGYIFANIDANNSFCEQPAMVDLAYKVKEGEQWRVGKINVSITGDSPHTREKVVLNRMELRPGDICDTRKLRTSERRMKAAGVFVTDPSRGAAPKIVFSPPPGYDPDKDSESSVAERPRKAPRTGGGSFRGQSPDASIVAPAGPNLVDLQVNVDSLAEIPAEWLADSVSTNNDLLPREMPAPNFPGQFNAPNAAPAVQSPAPASNVDLLRAMQGSRPSQPQAVSAAYPTTAAETVRRNIAPGQVVYRGQSPARNDGYGNMIVENPSAGYGGIRGGSMGPDAGIRTADRPTPAQYQAPINSSNQIQYGIYNTAATTTPVPGVAPSYGPPPTTAYYQNAPPGAVYAGAPAPEGIPPGTPAMGIPATPGAGAFVPPPMGDVNYGLFQQPTNTVDLQAQLEETQTGRIMFGVGINSDAGLVGNILLEEQNFDWTRVPYSWEDVRMGRAFRGAGEKFRIEASPGTQVSRYVASFTEPYLFDTPVSFTDSVSYYQRYFDDYKERRYGGRFGLGYQFPEAPDLSIRGAIRAEHVNLSDPRVLGVPELDRALGSHELYGFQASVTHDTRDSAFLATEGHLIDLSFEQVVGSFTYSREILEARQYFLLHQRADGSGRHTVAVGSKIGFTGPDTPIYDTFYAGGYATLRGFYFRGASPQDNTVKVGGDFEFLNSVEYMFPITANDMLRGVTFVDFGTVERSAGIHNDLFRVAPGIGLRITVPALGPAPIALDLAFPIAHANGDRIQNFSFFVGFAR